MVSASVVAGLHGFIAAGYAASGLFAAGLAVAVCSAAVGFEAEI